MKIEMTTQQMPIDSFRSERVEQVAQQENQANETAAKPQARKDVVNLSPAVDRYNKATEFLKDLPDTRPDKVQEIKGKIEAGEYNVNSKDVATKMLNFMKNGYAG